MRKLIAAVDLGASKILTGVATAQGQILMREKFPTLKENGPDDIMDRISASISKLSVLCCNPDEQIVRVVVATPGPLSYPEGIVIGSPNLAWESVHLKYELSKRLNRRVIVDKDTNLAALGEYYFGQQGQPDSLLYITVSTGVGGGLILDKQIWRGHTGGAGEIGHMQVEPQGRLCNCGRHGCLEALASGTAISRTVKELLQQGKGIGILTMGNDKKDITAREVGEAARQGDYEAQMIVSKVIQYLGTAVANLVNIINPEIVVLGGGVALGWRDLLLEALNIYVKREVFTLNAENLKIEITKLGEDIVLYGCIATALRWMCQGDGSPDNVQV
ncbi:MAG: ROK family protein [Syntrophomonadaceae bacterium]|nr:ROK family protein [Syntrophomonadaceae bacterium]MDD3024619.1 ROK family protein [Syntrophomonadaceae bacterium]